MTDVIKDALIQARSVLRTALSDTPADLEKPERRSVIERKIELIARALSTLSNEQAGEEVLPPDHQELFDGALNVAVQLAASENDQHKALGQIIAGLCAIIEKRAILSRLSLRSGVGERMRKAGDIIVRDGKVLRFIEEELEGEKWEIIGAVVAYPPLPTTPSDQTKG